MKPTIALHYPDRAAPQLLAGILYQVIWAARRWVALEEDEVLVIEGDEDLVSGTIENGEVVALKQEQIKVLSQRITARAPAAYETIFAFLCSFHTLSLENKRSTSVLTTNASLGKQEIDSAGDEADKPQDARLTIDLLRTWRDTKIMTPESASMLADGVRALVESYVDRAYPARSSTAKGVTPSISSDRVREAIAFLDAIPERWSNFLAAVVLGPDAGDSEQAFSTLESAIAGDPRAAGVHAEALAYRIVVASFITGAEADVSARHVTRESFAALIESEQANLTEWMRTKHPERLWQLDRLIQVERRVERLEGARAPEPLSEELRGRHLAAVGKRNATFSVLGFDERVPVDRAWNLSAQWSTESGDGRVFHAHRILEGPHRLVALVAEAGAGKSTVSRRIAFEAAARGSLVVRVHAKALASLADGALTFPAVLRRIIVDEIGVTVAEAEQLEANVDVLVVDGLDEAGKNADALAADCVNYAEARPRVALVVSSRPTHAAALRGATTSAQLLPMGDERTVAVVELLRAIGESVDSAAQAAERLGEVLGKTDLQNLPLYITLALHLARVGASEPVSKTTLFARAIRSLATRSSEDRRALEVEDEFAAQVLVQAAWWLASHGSSLTEDVVQGIAAALSLRSIDQAKRVEHAIRSWEGQALLRRERSGGQERIVFAHESIQEFVAAQHLVAQPQEWRRASLKERPHDSIIRFAVGLLGEEFLDDVFSASPPSTIESLLVCARASRELEIVPHRFTDGLAGQVGPMLASNIPYSVSTLVKEILPLVAGSPSLFEAAAEVADRAGGEWNRLAAWSLRLQSHAKLINATELLTLLAEIAVSPPQKHDSSTWELWRGLIEPALTALISLGRTSAIDEFLEELVLGDSRLNVKTMHRILGRLPAWGYSELLERHARENPINFSRLALRQDDMRAADRALLGLIRDTFAGGPHFEVDTKLPNLSALLRVFDFANAAFTDVNIIFFTGRSETMSVLLTGAAFAAGCDRSRLAGEAQYAIGTSAQGGLESDTLDLLALGVGSPSEFEWAASTGDRLPVTQLVNALSWPWAYARVALMLLRAHEDQAAARRGVAHALKEGASSVVHAAAHLGDLFGEELADVLAEAVAAGTDGAAPLLPLLARLEPTAPRTLKLVKSALSSTSSVLVNNAAVAARLVPSEGELASCLAAQLVRWQSWASGEGPLEKRDSGFVEPGTTLYAEQVVDALVSALAFHRKLAYDDLVRLAARRPRGSSALAALVVWVREDAARLSVLIDDVDRETLSPAILETILRTPESEVERARLLAFHKHPSVAVRRSIVCGLVDCPWVTRDEAVMVWTSRLEDSDAEVRNDAKRALEGKPRQWRL